MSWINGEWVQDDNMNYGFPMPVELLKLNKAIEHFENATVKDFIYQFTPYLQIELDKIQKEHPEETTGIEISDLVLIYFELKKEPNQYACEAVKQAYEKMIADYVKKNNSPSVSVRGKKTEKIHYPVDKINSLLFSKGFEKSGNYPISAEKHGSKKEITTILTLDFEELEQDTALTFRKLTPFDKRVYLSAGALLEAGNKYISATQIYKAMGGKGSPAPNQIENIVNSCKKMMIYRLRIDNRQEAEAYNYPLFQNGYFFLFPFEIVENVTINGKLTDFCIHALKDELLLIEYARERKQVKSFTLEQWTLPFSMTEEHILIDDYFRKRISHMQRDKEKTGRYINKILFKTIYENLGIDTKRGATAIMRKKKSRTAPKFRQLLEHYKDTGIITGYTEGQDGFTIKL